MTIEIKIENDDNRILLESLYDYEVKIRKHIKYNDKQMEERPEHKKVFDDVNGVLVNSLMRCMYLQGLLGAISD